MDKKTRKSERRLGRKLSRKEERREARQAARQAAPQAGQLPFTNLSDKNIFSLSSNSCFIFFV